MFKSLPSTTSHYLFLASDVTCFSSTYGFTLNSPALCDSIDLATYLYHKHLVCLLMPVLQWIPRQHFSWTSSQLLMPNGCKSFSRVQSLALVPSSPRGWHYLFSLAVIFFCWPCYCYSPSKLDSAVCVLCIPWTPKLLIFKSF